MPILMKSTKMFAYHYDPKVDVFKPLGAYMASYYQYIIYIIQWMI